MTIAAVVPVIKYAGSSSPGTSGPFSLVKSGTPITFSSNSHIKVYRYDTTSDSAPTLLVENTDYTLTGGPTAGSITLTSPQTGLLTAERLLIYREQPTTQDLNLTNGGSFSAAALEARFDRVVEMIQENREKIGRAVKATTFGVDAIPDFNLAASLNKIAYIAGTEAAPVWAYHEFNAADIAHIVDALDDLAVVAADLGGADTIGIVAAAIADVEDVAASIADLNTTAGWINAGQFGSAPVTATGGVTARTLADWMTFEYLPDEVRSASGNPIAFPDGIAATGSTFKGSDGSTQFSIGDAASADNYMEATGANAGGGPALVAKGSDTNIDVNLTAKGTGGIYGGNGSGTLWASLDSGGVTANYPYWKASITAIGVIFGAAGTDTNIPLILSPKGTGFLAADIPDSLAAGGNTRGANATDWQRTRVTASQVASGAGSAILGGVNNTASGQFTLAFGDTCLATAYAAKAIGDKCQATVSYASAEGAYALGNGLGKFARSGSFFGTTIGSAQAASQTLQASTTDATPTEMTVTGAAISSVNSIPLQNNSTLSAFIQIVARNQTDGTFAMYTAKALWSRGANAASSVLEFSSVTAEFEDVAAWNITVGVNTVQGCGTITVTGAAGKTIRWVAEVQSVEVTG